MIIDAHSHIQVQIEGYTGDSVNIYGVENNDVDKYLTAYKLNGVDACFTFPSEGLRVESVAMRENEALARVRDQYPDKIIPWACVCPAWPEKELRQNIRYVIDDLKMCGLKFVPICQGVSLANRGMDIVAEEAVNLNVPVTIHDGSPEYCSAIQLAYYARKYPRLRVLSAHGGLRELWPDLIDAAKELPNLWICLSGPTQWGLQKLYNELGPEKLLFGSDGGIGEPAITAAYLRRIEKLNAPKEHKDMILGKNAMRFLLGGKRESQENKKGKQC